MSMACFKSIISFIKKNKEYLLKNNLEITFHGGEPLLAGKEFLEFAFLNLREQFGDGIKISIQSNLWLIDNEYCELFKKFKVGVGTSLDGPKYINDYQRSNGYFDKTFAGIELLKKNGIQPGCIATITKRSSDKINEIFSFFSDNLLNFDIHCAFKTTQNCNDYEWALSPDEFGIILIETLKLYIQNLGIIKISSMDMLIKNVSNNCSNLCTFKKCLGEYIAIIPNGDLYTCNRFVGHQKYCIGNIYDNSSFFEISKSKAWKRQERWHQNIEDICAHCTFKNYCHGGCPYLALTSGSQDTDPFCKAYKIIYKYILDRGLEEGFKNQQLLNYYNDISLAVKKNPILYLMSTEPHPVDLVQASKRIIIAAQIGQSNDSNEAAKILVKKDILKKNDALKLVENFYERLNKVHKPTNLYLHITNICNLKCTHCYSDTGNRDQKISLAYNTVLTMIQDAAICGFTKIVITGGEPLLYPEIFNLLGYIKKIKETYKKLKIVLRTNLTIAISPKAISHISEVFDQIIVSIDGSERIHDRQRGKGSYRKTIGNLYFFDKATMNNKIVIASTLNTLKISKNEIKKEKQKVMKIKKKIPVSDIHFVPFLPLGKAKELQLDKLIVEKISVKEWLKNKHWFKINCGIGYVLSIESNGEVYPCHVMQQTNNMSLGNIYKESMKTILNKDIYTHLKNENINTIEKCKKCDLRYICGGVCKIYKNQDCKSRYDRAKSLVEEAYKTINKSNPFG